MSWLIHRIDDRLIHGQVVIAWGERMRPKRIVIADDAAAADSWERGLLASAAPGVAVEVLSVEAAALGYDAESAREGGAFLLVRDLVSALRLVELGARIDRFTLGGLHYAPGKDRINEYVYLGAEDRRAARELIGRGVRLELQDVPATTPTALADLDASVRSA
ncbi:MAG TPA: PTS sugar transporter subunit IIB [Candidatus Udaeobacter sp.]|jgi:mannose/fructose/N-acetylgalactosamine-specific phosphotransferase system component IIB|nr:PTS sugar transporter subunit IIB [Candidatus Udaeobacter sp.]